MSDYEAGLLVREAELLIHLEPLLREAKIEQSDPENDGPMKYYYDGVVAAYERAIAFIKGENK